MKLSLSRLIGILVITLFSVFLVIMLCPYLFVITCKSTDNQLWKLILDLLILIFILTLIITIVIKVLIKIWKAIYTNKQIENND